jgi:hypothetical protein
MSQVITKRVRLSRRIFLKGLTMAQAPVIVGLPPLVSMFNSTGTAYAADTKAPGTIGKRFVVWFNGNGIPERYWIPSRTGADYDLTPCLTPIGRLKDDVHVLSGLDNTYGGSGHPQSLCALMTCTRLSSAGPGAPSLDQTLAGKIGGNSRFRSLQIGVSQESFGGATQKNMSWAGPNRPLPPEEIPHRLFERLFGAKDLGWVNRKRSILDAISREGALLRKGLPKEDETRLDEHLSSIRDLERAIASLPPNYQQVTAPEEDFDMKDWPRVAKLQSDMLAYAFATGQTRVASYMLTKCQGLARFPWLGHTCGASPRLHPQGRQGAGRARRRRSAHPPRHLPVARGGVRVSCRQAEVHSGGEKSLLDNTVLMYVHEHAEAGPHKSSGMIALVAGSKDKLSHGRHTKSRWHDRRSLHDAVRRCNGRRPWQDADGHPATHRNPCVSPGRTRS